MLAHLSHRVAIGRLDFDHVGAKVGQQAGASWPSNRAAHLDDLEIGQRALAL
jgi:hypothetical protein